MTERVRVWIGVGLMVVATAVATSEARVQTPSVEVLLDRLGAYVDAYERELAAVVSEELYQQDVAGLNGVFPQTQQLRSDLLLARAGEHWVAFRDVYEVNGTPVQDRADRLVALFLSPPGDAAQQIARIVDESAKHNIGWVRRNLNVPTMVLTFARTANQGQSQFRRGGTTKVGDLQAREIRFTERRMPRIIQTRDNAAAQGAFWIDEESGRVLRTEIRITTGTTTAVIGVSYAHDAKMDLWLPVLMTERYTTPRQPAITGRATYQGFRKFNVTVGTIIK
jgi:hypothetical protein